MNVTAMLAGLQAMQNKALFNVLLYLVTAVALTIHPFAALHAVAVPHAKPTIRSTPQDAPDSQPATQVDTGADREPATFLSDEFANKNLGPQWQVVNPLQDGWLAINNGSLQLSVPRGASHDPWNFNRAMRVMQAVNGQTLALETHFTTMPTTAFQMQGLTLEQDLYNWLRYEVLHDGNALQLVTIATVEGVSTVKQSIPLPAASAIRLRVERSGASWQFTYSTDGQEWQPAAAFTHSLQLTAVGPHVANHSATGAAPAFTAGVAYVRNLDNETVAAAQQQPDQQGPTLHGVQSFATGNDLTLRWYTDEPSSSSVAFGSTSAHGTDVAASGDGFAHTVTIPALNAGQRYHYRIVATDAAGNSSTQSDSLTFAPSDTVGPTINIWYGDQQSYGQMGQPQRWANILGNVSDPDGVVALRYTLNGGSSTDLSIGPDGRRLANVGDFNVDLLVADLAVGNNTVVITATDSQSHQTVRTVTFTHQPTTLQRTYSMDWSTLTQTAQIQNVAHVIDGKWTLNGGKVRTTEPGYDRLIGIGDVEWQDYEILVPITVHDFPDSDYGVGILLRWDGHTLYPRAKCGQADRQPRCGYLPLGAIAWYQKGNNGTPRLRFLSSTYNESTDDHEANGLTSAAYTMAVDVEYWFKARVESDPAGSIYRLKVWPVGQSEPGTWAMTGQADPSALAKGSVLLLSHRTDASFGAVQVTPLGQDQTAPVITLLGDNPLALTVGDNYVDPGATATDDVDGDLTGQIVVGGDQVDTSRAGLYTVTYDVQDAAGNSATQQQRTVQVTNAQDTTPPVLTVNGDNPLTLTVGDSYTDPGATATDDVDGDISAQIVVGGDQVDTSAAGTYTVTYDVQDAAGNLATQQQRRVQVTDAPDTTPPSITVNGDNPLIIAAGTAFVDPGATAIDNVDGDLSDQVMVSGDTVNVNQPGVYVLFYDVTDSSGNVASQKQRTVQIVDRIAPVITLQGEAQLTITIGSTYVEAGATATDNVDGNLTASIVIGGDTVDTTRPVAYVITYDVADRAGNQATQRVRRVTVQPAADVTPPTISLLGANPLTLTVGSTYSDPGATAVDETDGDLTAAIVVGGDTVQTERPNSYTVTYDVTDQAGNQAAQMKRTVVVVDDVAPVITLKGEEPLYLDLNQPYTEPGYMAVDNVDGDLSANVVVAGTIDVTTASTYTLTYTVSDSSGNEATAVKRTVVVESPTAQSGFQLYLPLVQR